MSNHVLLILCFVLGIIFKKSKRFPENTAQVLNAFILHVSLPALILIHIHDIQTSNEIFLPASMPWLQFTIAIVFFYTFYQFNLIKGRVAVALILTAGLGNTSFVGIPLLESYLGKESLGYAIIADQLGTFLVLSFPGLILATISEGNAWSIVSLVKRVLTFAPVMAIFLALVLRHFEYPEWTRSVLQRLGDTLAPLALISVGYLLNLSTLKGYRLPLLLGLGFKLILSPFIIFFAYKNSSSDRILYEVIVLESAMAPMITSTIIVIDKNIEPHLASLMLGLGIPISFVSTYFFLYILKAGIL